MLEHVGQQLRHAREARALTLEQVARATHMRLHYLQALEAGDLEAIPSLTQARGFLRAYASYLGMNPAPLLSSFDGASSALEVHVPIPVPTASTPVSPTLSFPKTETAEAQEIFARIGEQLRQQRELLGLSIDDVVRHTHLRRHYLQALENGSLNTLPSPVQGRGMLKNYAVFLGLDPEPLLLSFADGLQARLAARRRAGPEPAAQLQRVGEQPNEPSRSIPSIKPRRPRLSLPAPLRRLLSSDLLVGSSLAVLLAAFFLWGAIRTFNLRSAAAVPSATAPSIADVLLATDTVTPSPTAEPTPLAVNAQETVAAAEEPAIATDSNIPVPAAGGDENVQVYITVLQRSWLQVSVDGRVQFSGRVLPGGAYSFAGDERIEILTGNAAALQVFYNGQDQGVLGSYGQVIHHVYSAQGVELPTPTITPTPTRTPVPSATPRTSATPPAGTVTAPALP